MIASATSPCCCTRAAPKSTSPTPARPPHDTHPRYGEAGHRRHVRRRVPLGQIQAGQTDRHCTAHARLKAAFLGGDRLAFPCDRRHAGRATLRPADRTGAHGRPRRAGAPGRSLRHRCLRHAAHRRRDGGCRHAQEAVPDHEARDARTGCDGAATGRPAGSGRRDAAGRRILAADRLPPADRATGYRFATHQRTAVPASTRTPRGTPTSASSSPTRYARSIAGCEAQLTSFTVMMRASNRVGLGARTQPWLLDTLACAA